MRTLYASIAGFTLCAGLLAASPVRAENMFSFLVQDTPSRALTLTSLQFDGQIPLPADVVTRLATPLYNKDVTLQQLMELTRVLKRAGQLAGCPFQLGVELDNLDTPKGNATLHVSDILRKDCTDLGALSTFSAANVPPLPLVQARPVPQALLENGSRPVQQSGTDDGDAGSAFTTTPQAAVPRQPSPATDNLPVQEETVSGADLNLSAVQPIRPEGTPAQAASPATTPAAAATAATPASPVRTPVQKAVAPAPQKQAAPVVEAAPHVFFVKK